jgi:hypothetical protein
MMLLLLLLVRMFRYLKIIRILQFDGDAVYYTRIGQITIFATLTTMFVTRRDCVP